MLLLVIIPSISATTGNLGTFKQNECINLLQTCADCTYNNITSVTIGQYSTKLLGLTSMERSGTIFNYTFCDTLVPGIYTVDGYGNPAGTKTIWNYKFEVTATGQDSTVSKSITYVLLFIFSIIIFGGLVYMGIGIPYSNKTDEMTGYVLAVSNIKYLKLTLLGLSYVVAVFIAYFSWMLSYAYLDMDFLSSILQFLFYGLAVLLVPIFILFVYLIIANLVRDSKIAEALQRGFTVDGKE